MKLRTGLEAGMSPCIADMSRLAVHAASPYPGFCHAPVSCYLHVRGREMKYFATVKWLGAEDSNLYWRSQRNPSRTCNLLK